MGKENKRKRRTKVPDNETPEQRTKRLTEFRVNRACKDILSLGQLAGAPYTLTKAHKAQILGMLKGTCDTVATAFETGVVTETSFRLGT